MKIHYYFVHGNGGRMVTLDPTQFDHLKAEGWSLEKEWHPADAKPVEAAKSEPIKRGPGRPRKVSDEHSAADH